MASRVEYAPALVPDCRILGAKQAFTREVPMDDPNDPYSPDNLSWNWSRGGPWARPFSGRRGPRVPPPPGPPPKPGKAQREQEKRAEARAERLHLVALTNAGVIIMGVALAAVVVMVALVLVSHH
jgi:hypothetical protein